MIDIDSYSLSVDEISLLKNPFIAGVILFSRNIKSIAQTQALSNEIKSKLKRIRPKTLGQAIRIDGVTPAAVIIILSYLKRSKIKETA